MRRTGVFLLAIASAMPLTAQSQEPPGGKPAAAPGPPVLLVQASAALVDAFVFRKVDETGMVDEVIRDVPSGGVRRTLGEVHANLVPDPTHGAIDIEFSGTTQAQTIAYRPFTRLYTSTATGFDVSYRVLFNARGTWGRCEAAGAGTCITLLDVVDRYNDRDSTAANVVRLNFPQQKRELEAIVNVRAKRRKSERLEADVTAALQGAGQALGFGWFTPFAATVETPQFYTTTTHVHVAIALATAAKKPPNTPPPVAADADLSVRVHESLLNEAARVTLGGQILAANVLWQRADQVTELLLRDGRKEADRAAGLKALEKLLTGLADKSPTVTLAQDDPLRFAFTEKGLTVEAHLTAIHLGDQAWPGLRVKAKYVLESGAGGVFAVRKGAIQLIPDDAMAKKDKALLAALHASVGVVFAEVFKERLALADLPRPAGTAALWLETGDGWLALAWKLKKG